MKAQTQIISFVLLFAISIGLFVSAVLWSGGIFQTNTDYSNIKMAESFMKNLGEGIISISNYGGEQSLEFDIKGRLRILHNCVNNYKCIQFEDESLVDVPNYWIYLFNDSYVIRERKVGGLIQLQLYFPLKEGEIRRKIDIFTDDNAVLSSGGNIVISKNSSELVNNELIIKIKLEFS